MGNSLTLIKNIFSYDLIYINNLLSKVYYPIKIEINDNEIYFNLSKNYIKTYDLLARLERSDEVIYKYESNRILEIYGEGVLETYTGFLFHVENINYIKIAIYKVYFHEWVQSNEYLFLNLIYSGDWDYVSLLEEYVIDKYKSDYRQEVLNYLIN